MNEIKIVEIDVVVRHMLEEAFPLSDTEKALSFFERGFPENGVMTITALLLQAGNFGKAFGDVFPLLEEKWNTVWAYQHPSIRANPHTAKLFVQNRNCYRSLYQSLGIPIPTLFDREK